MQFPEARLLIFCKAPIAGQVKTRLIPALTASGAAELHRQLAIHTLKKFAEATICPIELWGSPDVNHAFFRECRRLYGVELKIQSGADLGEKMHHALTETLRESPYSVLIGCDCPCLMPDDLTETFTALMQGIDIVLAPAEDGGYVLIAMRHPQPKLFDNIPWGGNTVLEETRDRLRALRLSWLELQTRWDVDTSKDLERLEKIAL